MSAVFIIVEKFKNGDFAFKTILRISGCQLTRPIWLNGTGFKKLAGTGFLILFWPPSSAHQAAKVQKGITDTQINIIGKTDSFVE